MRGSILVRQDGYSFSKVIHHAFNRGRTSPLSSASLWNYWTTVFICLIVTPALTLYPQFFEWVGVDFSLSDLDVGLRFVGVVVMQITFMGFLLSLHNHEYVSLGTMIHRPIELVILSVIFYLGEIHWQFFVFMFAGVPVPAGVCFILWRRDTTINSPKEYWKRLAYPERTRTILGRWLEKLGWIILLVGFLILLQPSWVLDISNISQEPLVIGYFRVVGWAYMILGWCYFMNARHEYDFFYDVVILQNLVGICCIITIWFVGWFPSSLLLLLLLVHSIVLSSTLLFAWFETRTT